MVKGFEIYEVNGMIRKFVYCFYETRLRSYVTAARCIHCNIKMDTLAVGQPIFIFPGHLGIGRFKE